MPILNYTMWFQLISDDQEIIFMKLATVVMVRELSPHIPCIKQWKPALLVCNNFYSSYHQYTFGYGIKACTIP